MVFKLAEIFNKTFLKNCLPQLLWQVPVKICELERNILSLPSLWDHVN